MLMITDVVGGSSRLVISQRTTHLGRFAIPVQPDGTRIGGRRGFSQETIVARCPGTPGRLGEEHNDQYLPGIGKAGNGAESGCCLCTVIGSHGSTPRHTGSKMLVYADGSIFGTVGGGELENRVIQEAVQAIADGLPRRVSYSMVDPQRGDPGICGGQVEVYVEPILPKPLLVVIGAGHVGKAVLHLAHWLGFLTAVSDDRPGIL